MDFWRRLSVIWLDHSTASIVFHFRKRKSALKNLENESFPFNYFYSSYANVFLFLGIYLCLVMTMTSVSVIMAVMVINLYNRGMKTRRAPKWLRKLILEIASSPLKMKHDIEHLAKVITLVSHLVSIKFPTLANLTRILKHINVKTRNFYNGNSYVAWWTLANEG